MRKLIYFMPAVLATIDPTLISADYKHSAWFRLAGSRNQFGVPFPQFFSSRVHNIATPWPLSPTLSPIPPILPVDQKLDRAFDAVANQLVESCLRSNKVPYLLWSGGIDSTAILVSLLKNNNQEFLQRLVVVHSDVSIQENAYFYHRYIKSKLQTLDIANFSITPDNYQQLLVLDGDAGNQIFGCASIYNVFYRQPELLDQPWIEIESIKEFLPGRTDLSFNLVEESLPYAPFEIRTVYDLLWWCNFNFKWDEVLVRSMFYYAQNLSPEQSQDFYQNNLFRVFEQPDIQRWAMLYKEQRRQSCQLHPKWHVKQYIFDFDKNDLWFAHKQEAASGSKQTRATTLYRPNTIIGFDCDWNPVDLSDSKCREELGRILERL